ncbi:MAG: hypothetical protein NC211_02960 [Alistipes senegalensis]|nr:hypothetical protein [Oxalobacter formigenes]MCM1280781.1 hypothetical protein [Alistipes senegalensis]
MKNPLLSGSNQLKFLLWNNAVFAATQIVAECHCKSKPDYSKRKAEK